MSGIALEHGDTACSEYVTHYQQCNDGVFATTPR